MRAIARGPEGLRRELFRETARKMGIHEAIVEKDFWVCAVLEVLFSSPDWKRKFIFKGGTSLSKVYGLIERFSEDIDLILDWRELGFLADDPWKPDSNTRKDRFVKDMIPITAAYLRETFVPSFQRDLDDCLGPLVRAECHEDGVRIVYPGAFKNPAILPWILLEIGPLAGWTPHEEGTISSYAADHFRASFSNPTASVTVVTRERTFWEKATILHQEAHRPTDKQIPPRYSRHYYDLAKMARTSCADSALSRIDILDAVVEFKERFYRAPWSNLANAKPGTFRLVPPEYRVPALAKDYESMKAMFFHDESPFCDILADLRTLENRINSIKPQIMRI